MSKAKKFTAYSEGLGSRIVIRDERGEVVASVPVSGETIQTHAAPDRRPMANARRIAALLTAAEAVRS